MAAKRGRSPAAATITQNSIDEASAALEGLPEKPKTSWSLREAVNQLQGTINAALERGYSHQEVAEMLGEQGIRISPASLKSYLAAINRDAGSSAPKRRRSSAKASAPEEAAAPEEAPAPEPTPAPESQAEEAPAPKKTRGRGTGPRTANKAKAPAAKTKKTGTESGAPRGRRKKTDSAAKTAS
ncbi:MULTISPECIES: hypothetical protein [unclassified Leptolyngbya]|uniref:hypothetical protein n=1 Tax=unclassified Leptolyngbya TaxID=2650499 RepID=UPI001683FF84|nr:MULTISPECIES: hypothetical protein [unclassified Leptolyngbya]MBD1909850.1 hypothetical protein [Leptolyngbya sp. FACHB-8]MBD2156946.1 hypothetical protein [Leptolyngbya sp. FACHB-16]